MRARDWTALLRDGGVPPRMVARIVDESNEPGDAGGARVYFWPIENLARAPRPSRLPSSRLVAPQRLTFVETTTVPDPGSLWAVLAGFKTRAHATWLETIVWWRDKLPSPFHLVGGHAPRLQPSLMELDCALSSAGLDRERLDGRTKRTRDAFRDAEDWTLVFRVDSDERREMWWGDAGALDFWMRRQDIASMSVERAWCVLEST